MAVLSQEDIQELVGHGGSSYAVDLLDARERDLNSHEKALRKRLSDTIVEEASLGSGLAGAYTLQMLDFLAGKGAFKKREYR